MACYLEHCDISEQALAGNETLEKIDRVLEYIDVHLAENIGWKSWRSLLSCILIILSASSKTLSAARLFIM